MAFNTPKERGSVFNYQGRSERGSDILKRISMGTSGLDLNRMNSPILRSLASPVQRTNKIQSPDSSLTDEINFQCRRLNADFTATTGALNASVTQTLRKAIDLILEHKNKDVEVEKLKEKITELTERAQSSSKISSNVTDAERKLALREERLAIDELKINTERKILQNEKGQIGNIKKQLQQVESELKAEKEQNKAHEARIHELFSENLEKETELHELRNKESTDSDTIIKLQNDLKEENEKLNAKINEINRKERKFREDLAEFESQKKSMAEELKIVFELKEKLHNEFEYLEANKKDFNSFRVDMEIEQAKLKDLRKALENERQELTIAQKQFLAEKSKTSYSVPEQLPVEFTSRFKESVISIEDRDDSVIVGKGKYNEMDPLVYFPQVKDLISDVTLETNRRKMFIQEWINSLSDREFTFSSRLEDISLICDLLTSTIELENNPQLTVLLEPLLSVIKDVLSELSAKKEILDESFKLYCHESLESFDYEYSGHNCNIFSELLMDFEKKAAELSELEFHLNDMKERLEMQNEENSRIAQYLKEERIEFEKEKNFAEAGLMQLQEKLDQGLDLMNKKERDLLSLQQLYDCRSPFSDDLSVSLN